MRKTGSEQVSYWFLLVKFTGLYLITVVHGVIEDVSVTEAGKKRNTDVKWDYLKCLMRTDTDSKCLLDLQHRLLEL